MRSKSPSNLPLFASPILSADPRFQMNYRLDVTFCSIQRKSIVLNYIGEIESTLLYSSYLSIVKKVKTFTGNDISNCFGFGLLPWIPPRRVCCCRHQRQQRSWSQLFQSAMSKSSSLTTKKASITKLERSTEVKKKGKEVSFCSNHWNCRWCNGCGGNCVRPYLDLRVS